MGSTYVVSYRCRFYTTPYTATDGELRFYNAMTLEMSLQVSLIMTSHIPNPHYLNSEVKTNLDKPSDKPLALTILPPPVRSSENNT